MGAEDGPDDDEPFEEKFPRLVKQLEEHFTRSAELQIAIRGLLKRVDNGS